MVVTETNRTKRIANGVEARVIRDVVTEKGQTVEATDDWYAQDAAGNIWYLGEPYQHRVEVVTVGQEKVEVPFGAFARNVLMTRDLVPLEPKVR